jgi:hypothetical protein
MKVRPFDSTTHQSREGPNTGGALPPKMNALNLALKRNDRPALGAWASLWLTSTCDAPGESPPVRSAQPSVASARRTSREDQRICRERRRQDGAPLLTNSGFCTSGDRDHPEMFTAPWPVHERSLLAG